MESITPHCSVCDGAEYYLQAGFYYCKECHTQSVGYRETLLDHQANLEGLVCQRRSLTSIKKPRPKKVKEAGSEVRWTSWEGHNFVLKGLVDELVSLGARPELRTVALQLWAKYLGKLEVAFTSKTEQLLPKFGLNQTPKDYMVIYGQVAERRRKLEHLLVKNKSSRITLERLADTTLTERNKFLVAKKLCVIAEYKNIMAELASSKDVMSQIDERMKLIAASKVVKANRKPTTPTPGSKSVAYNASALSAIQTLQEKQNKRKQRDGLDDRDDGDSSDEWEEEKKIKTDKYYLMYSSCYDSMHLTRQKVLALLVLALNLSKDKIQISDLLRWIKEGHVSYYNVTQFFPEGVRFNDSDLAFTKAPLNVRYKSLEKCAVDIAGLLGVERFPAPDHAGLARRYVAELELPASLACLAERLMASCRLGSSDGLTSHEAVTLAFVIVVLKSLLGLDGRTEGNISAAATEINRLMDADAERRDEPRLFVWDDWVRYIVCRKTVIASEHFSTRHACDVELEGSIDSYLDWWDRNEQKDEGLEDRKETRKSRFSAHKKRTAEMLVTVDKLADFAPRQDGRRWNASLMPRSSYLQAIRSRWSEGDGDDIRPDKILAYKHSLTDIEFLVNPKSVKQFARSKGVRVVIDKCRVPQDVHYDPCVVKGSMKMTNAQGTQVVIDLEPFLDHTEALGPSPKGKKKKKKRAATPRSKVSVQMGESIPGSVPDETSPRSRSLIQEYDPNKNVDDPNKTVDDEECLDSSMRVPEVGFSSSSEGSDSEGEGLRTVTLNAPCSDYWIYKVHPRQPEGYFETEIEPDFPAPFRWLLNECSEMLEMRTVDLYTQIRLVEDLCSQVTVISDLELSCPPILAMNRSTTE